MPSFAVDVIWLWLWAWLGFNFNSTKLAAAGDDVDVDSCQLGAALVQRPEYVSVSLNSEARSGDAPLCKFRTKRAQHDACKEAAITEAVSK